MPQSLAAIYIHLVCSTHDRQPILATAEERRLTTAYLAEVSNRLECPALAVGAATDHVHVLARLGRTVTVADWTKELKRVSSRWAKTQGMPTFAWQSGYGAFSVSADNVEAARRYVLAQEVHHRTMSFQDEYRQLLRDHGIEWDERFVWQ